jgi:branched-chain amino acid transport system substrate-binding protein
MYFRDGLILCQISLMLFSFSFSAPTEVRLGGLFPLFRLSGEVLSSGQVRLASFLMAVRDINADASVLPNTTVKVSIRDTKFNVGKTFFSSLDLVTKSFKGKGVDACIGAASSGESEAAATVFSHFSTVQISYSSTSPLLSTRINSPYFARTCPSDAFQGAAMADIVSKYYGW